MKKFFLIIITFLLIPASVKAGDRPPDIQTIRKAIIENERDWTAVDYGRTFALGLIRDNKETLSALDYLPYGEEPLPDYVNWGKDGLNFVSPVKDQGSCGSCWAFAAVGALESTIAISENSPGAFYDLSEQILISCCTANNGCEGGSSIVSANFLFTDGTYFEDCFSYQATDLPCEQACPEWRSVSFKIYDYQRATWSLEALKEAICYHGPIQSSMDVYDDFYSYSSGVYEYTTGKYLGGHAIVLIGYQDKPNGEYGGGYFICKNSWGTGWGEGGFFKVGYSQVSQDMRFGDDSHIYFLATPPPPLIPTPTSIPPPIPTPTSIPPPIPTPTSISPPIPPPTPEYSSRCENDFNGDGTADIALFRPESGLWAIRKITRFYFGGNYDRPVPGDYDGDRTTDIGLFRSSRGLWAIRKMTRYYFGSMGDIPAVGDYDGDGTYEPGLFRPSSGLWAIKGLSRVYFGSYKDIPVARDYTGDGTTNIALFRREIGLWAIRSSSRFYFGGDGDQPVPGDYDGDRVADIGLFRPSSGLWAIRGVRRAYFGGPLDQTIPSDYTGDGRTTIAVFRNSSGLWALENGERLYFGKTGDIPVIE
jgi:papain like protease